MAVMHTNARGRVETLWEMRKGARRVGQRGSRLLTVIFDHVLLKLRPIFRHSLGPIVDELPPPLRHAIFVLRHRR